ncbi:SDR family oxidoreductase [Streptomyces sp. TS71-3]|uniref:SDR family oxidoreductase n=1 Tax=Streptomyces sp. TS71-3 TaxID=2733862 RepID=UPI001B200DF1|nr:NAD(P)H-binding protein [Streptomyces sp. TS71-3]GHJ38934.1 nucleotide-diphosphate-sugar epimerase [Streptomyces sp. TS71-3]
MATIVVTGGTGNLGGLITQRLRDQGQHEVRVLSRHAPRYAVDLRTGAGLDEALSGADVVVHCASAPRGDEQAAERLVASMRRTGVRHVVFISIVGVEEVPLRYYRAKLAAERVIADSGVGWTLLRATQFHDLVASVLGAMAKPPVMLVPAGVSDQPIEAAEVADRMAGLAVGEPSGRVPDMGGPEVLGFPELARTYLGATGRRRRVVPVPLVGRAYRAMRDGGHLTPQRAVGRRTFGEYLTERFAQPV